MTNLTLNCGDVVPSVAELFEGLQLEHKIFLILPMMFFTFTVVIYVANLRYAIENGHKETKGNVAALVTIYPVSQT
jgi:hypothetical protein